MKWAFNEISLNKFSSEQIYNEAKKLGLACNKNRFLQAIRNPVYCGKIIIEKYKDEERYLVKGLHDPLITETMFYDIQDILDGRKRRVIKTTIMSHEDTPLRGFLTCSKCSRALCASASKGGKTFYHYYHCSSKCGYRKKAEEINELFQMQFQDFVLRPDDVPFFKAAILDSFINETKNERNGKSRYITEINDLNKRVARARELLIAGDINGTEYKEIKSECESKINLLELRLSEIPTNLMTIEDLEELLDSAIASFTALDLIYLRSGLEILRKIIGYIPCKIYLRRTATSNR